MKCDNYIRLPTLVFWRSHVTYFSWQAMPSCTMLSLKQHFPMCYSWQLLDWRYMMWIVSLDVADRQSPTKEPAICLSSWAKNKTQSISVFKHALQWYDDMTQCKHYKVRRLHFSIRTMLHLCIMVVVVLEAKCSYEEIYTIVDFMLRAWSATLSVTLFNLMSA